MAEITHKYKNMGSAYSVAVANTWEAFLTITEAELDTAGFTAGDDCIVFMWAIRGIDAGSNIGVDARLQHNSADLITTYGFQAHATSANDIGVVYMQRFTLVDGQDVIAEVRSSSTDARIRHAQMMIMKLDDFGTEGTDWDFVEELNNTTWAAAATYNDRATITIDGNDEDWVIIGQIDQTEPSTTDQSINHQIDVGGTGYLNAYMEAEWTSEVRNVFLIHYEAALASGSQTIKLSDQSDLGAGTANRVDSRIFAFKAGQFTDVYNDRTTATTVNTGTETQVATVTDTVSTQQNMLVLAVDIHDSDAGDENVVGFIKDGGTETTPDPSADGWEMTRDGSDNIPRVAMAYLADQAAAALDIDFFVSHDDASNLNSIEAELIVWGMELAGGGGGGGGAGVFASGGGGRRSRVW